MNNVLDWTPPDNIKEELKKTGFGFLLSLTSKVRHNFPLLSAIIDCYDPREGIFNFGSRKLIFGLEDVLYIIGLPIDGKPITGSTCDFSDLFF